MESQPQLNRMKSKMMLKEDKVLVRDGNVNVLLLENGLLTMEYKVCTGIEDTV
jgi:hypothetical protein